LAFKKLGQLCYNFLLGPVAQLVEQRIENPRVDGSIPSQATKQSRHCENTDGFSFGSVEKQSRKKAAQERLFWGN
jgi:hypothetical protein